MSKRQKKRHGIYQFSLFCEKCQRGARLVRGNPSVWICDGCGDSAPCYAGTENPHCTLADKETLAMRVALYHQHYSRLWVRHDYCGLYNPQNAASRWKIRSDARIRLRDFLAEKLGIDPRDAVPAKFDIATCRRAWTVLTGVTQIDILEWDKARKAQNAGRTAMIKGRDIELAKKWDQEGEMRMLDNGGWSILYRNNTHPRMTRLVQTNSNNEIDPVVSTVFVDGHPCKDIEEVILRLSAHAPAIRLQKRVA